MENEYSKEDIQDMQEYLIRVHYGNEDVRKFLKRLYVQDGYDSKLRTPDDIKEYLKNKWIKDCSVSMWYKSYEESKHYHIYNTLYTIEYSDIPMHVNDIPKSVYPLLMWRLQIGK